MRGAMIHEEYRRGRIFWPHRIQDLADGDSR